MIIDQLADLQIVIHGKETSIPDIDETIIDSMKVGELKTLYPYIDSLIFTYTYGQYTLSNEDMKTLHRIKNTIKSTIIRKQEAVIMTWWR